MPDSRIRTIVGFCTSPQIIQRFFFSIIEFLNSTKQFVGCQKLSEVLNSTPNILTVSLCKSTGFGRFYRKLQNRHQERKKTKQAHKQSKSRAKYSRV